MLKRIAATLAACAVIATAAPSEAQEAVFLIRHAEKQASGDDPALTGPGRDRAAAWAEMLGDAGIDHVVTTDARRTRETGGIIAEALAVERSEVAAADVTGLIDLLDFDHSDARVLVVAHEETIPSILTGLGLAEVIELDQGDYDNLFIVTAAGDGERSLTHLHMPGSATHP